MTVSTEHLAIDDQVQSLLFVDARSPLRFSDRPVDPQAVRAAYDLIKWGPTGNNAMTLRLAIAESDEARAQVAAAATPGNRAKVEGAPLVLVAASDVDYHELVHITAPGVEGLRDKLHATPERRAVNAHDNAWLQIGYLIVGLRAAGLAVRPMGGFDKAALDATLLAGTSWRSELLLAIGYPAEDGDQGVPPRAGRPSWDDAARVL